MRAMMILFVFLFLTPAIPAGGRDLDPVSTPWKKEVEQKLATGDFAGAMTQLMAVEAAGQADIDYYFLRGKAASALGNPAKALEHLDRALAINPGYAAAMGHKGVVLLETGKAKEAESVITRAIEIAPSGELHYARGAVRMALGRMRDALGDLNAAIGLDPGNDEYLVARGDVHRRAGQMKAAQRDYNRAIEADPKNARAYLGRGDMMLAKQEYAAARIDLDRCVELAPKFSSCYLRRGKLFQIAGEAHRALEDYLKATELAPKSAEAWFERAGVELELNRFEAAETSARKIVALENSGKAQKILGVVYSARGNFAAAILTFTKAINTQPKDFEAFFMRGNAYALSDEFDKALTDFNRSIKLEKRFIDPYLAKASIYSAQNDWAKAVEVYTEAIAVEPGSPSLYHLRSQLYEAMGDFDASYADFKRAKDASAKLREER